MNEKQRIQKTSIRRQKQIAAYKEQPVALVTRPLRRIDDATCEFNDKKERVPSRQYRAARIAANRCKSRPRRYSPPDFGRGES